MDGCREFVMEFEQTQPLAGATEHEQLYGRDEPDQHPISSISGLTAVLENLGQGEGTVAEELARHEADPLAHPDLFGAQTAALTAHISSRTNPHEVTAEQTGALGLSVAATCEDEAASPTSTPNVWYVPKTMPKPTAEAGMMVDVFWSNGHTGGLGYNVSLIWGEPGGADNETILSGISVTDSLTGEVSIPTEGTVRYQLIDQSGRLTFKYVSGPVLLRQYSTSAAAGTVDKPVRGMELEYLPGMEVYVALDQGNTAPTMRLVPDSGPTLPVYGNGAGTATGDIPAGYICHLVNAEDHWQLINSISPGSSEESAYIAKTTIAPHGSATKADMTASQIINAARRGVVLADYTDPATDELRTYQYFKQMPDGRAVFAVNGYIEAGIPKQTLIYVDYAGNVTTETRDGLSLGITGASAGQMIRIKSVDEQGRPTAFEAVTI